MFITNHFLILGMRKVILFFFLCNFFQTHGQSPWIQKKRKAYTQISYTMIPDYIKLYGNPNYATERTVTDNTIQFFGEYGITDKTSLILSVPFKIIKTGELTSSRFAHSLTSYSEAGSESSLGNIEIGIKYNFSQSKWVFSGQFNVEANTSSFNNNTGIRTGFDAWTFTPLLLIGRGFKKIFMQSNVGLNVRTNDYSSNLRFGAEVGMKFFDTIWAIGFFDLTSSLKNGNIVLPIFNIGNGLYVNDMEFAAYGVKFIGEFSNQFGVTAGFATIISGNNVPLKLPTTFGLYYKL